MGIGRDDTLMQCNYGMSYARHNLVGHSGDSQSKKIRQQHSRGASEYYLMTEFGRVWQVVAISL